jgi:NAD(P)-dependent dehydrogenase (short-subunit alcohol dehydrogenase family)
VDRPQGHPVNALAPGFFQSEMSEQFDNDYLENRVIPRTLTGRPGRSEKLSAALIFLASDASSYVTGTTLPVEGGMPTT